MAIATDPAGNTATSDSFDFTVDTTAPSPPAVSHLANPKNAGDDSGFTVAAGAAVTVSVNGVALSAAQLLADFTAATSGGSDEYATRPNIFTGAEAIAVSATLSDTAGNVSAPATLTLKPVDTTPPATTVNVSMSYLSGHWNLGGTAEAGSTVAVSDGAKTWSTSPAAERGTSDGGQQCGHRDFTVTATDAAGNATSSDYYEGTTNADNFSFASEAALSAAALISGGAGNDTILMTPAARARRTCGPAALASR
jgi:hypothetical protein